MNEKEIEGILQSCLEEEMEMIQSSMFINMNVDTRSGMPI